MSADTEIFFEKDSGIRLRHDLIQISLKPNGTSPISDAIELRMWVRAGEVKFEKISSNFLSELTVGQITLIDLTEEDLHLLNPPYPKTTLFLFGKELEFEQNLPEFRININCHIEVEQISSTSLSGRIVSGAIIIPNPTDASFGSSPDWLWSSPSEVLKQLIFGKSNLQIKTEDRAKQITLYEFAGRTGKATSLEEQGILWKQVACKRDSDLMDPNVILEQKKTTIIDFLKKFKTYSNLPLFEIELNTADSSVFFEVKGTKKNHITEYQTKQFFRLSGSITIQNERSSNANPPNPKWKILTLQQEGDDYRLIDYDEVDLLLRTGETAPESNDYSFNMTWTWSQGDSGQTKTERLLKPLPPLFLVGIQSDGTSLVQDRYAWQPIQPEVKALGPFPPAWIRYALNSELPEPTGNTLRKRYPGMQGGKMHLEGKLTKNLFSSIPTTSSWKMQIDMADSFPRSGDNPLRMALVLHLAQNSVELKIRGIEVELTSDDMPFLSQVQQDPSYIPSEKYFHSSWEKGSLVFKNSLSNYLDEFLIKAELTTEGVKIKAAPNTVVAYLPHQKALINTTSATGDNLASNLQFSTLLFNGIITEVKASMQGGITILQFQTNDKGFTNGNSYVNYDCQLASVNPFEPIGSPLTITEQVPPLNPHDPYEVHIKGKIELSDHTGSDHPYQLLIGTTKQIKERDVNQGLLPAACTEFSFIFPPPEQRQLTRLVLEKFITGQTIKALNTFLPWMEGGYIVDPEKGLTHSELKLYHRNLVMEHAERALSLEYSTTNHIDDQRNPTRDRYCLAATLFPLSEKMENWLPHAHLKDKTGHPITPHCQLSAFSSFPAVTMQWRFEENLPGNPELPSSTLTIQEQKNNWLQYGITPLRLDEKETPEFEITSSAESATYQSLNSYVPLIIHEDVTYDNLGVVRKNLEKSSDPQWKLWDIKLIKMENDTYYSISVVNQLLAYEDNGSTLVFFSCDALKIPVGPNHAETFEEVAPGVYGFYSTIGSLSQQAHSFPQYKGVPFYVTRLTQLTLTQAGIPETLRFQAVLINPEKLTQSEQSDQVLDAIQYAVTQQSFVHFEYQFATRKLALLEGSTIAWEFSTYPQNTQKLSGRLVSLKANVKVDDSQVSSLVLTNIQGVASIMNSLWDFSPRFWLKSSSSCTSSPIYKGGVILVSHALDRYVYQLTSPAEKNSNAYLGCILEFSSLQQRGIVIAYTGETTTPEDSYQITILTSQAIPEQNNLEAHVLQHQHAQYEFDSFFPNNEAADSTKLKISANSPSPFDYHLSVSLNFELSPSLATPSLATKVSIEAIIESAGAILYLRQQNLSLQLQFVRQQDIYSCFTLEGSSFYAVILWSELNVNPQGSGTSTILLGTFLEKIAEENASLILNDKMTFSGKKFGMRIFTCKKQADGQRNWRQLDHASWFLKEEAADLQIIVDDQLIYDSYRPHEKFSSYFIFGPNNTVTKRCETQCPVVLKFDSYQEKKVSLSEDQYYFATSIIPTAGSKVPDVVLPQFQQSLCLSPFIRDETKKQGFVRLRNESNSNEGLTFYSVLSTSIPLNLCLEQDRVSLLPRLSDQAPHISHHRVYGNRLRLNLHDSIQWSDSEFSNMAVFKFDQNCKWVLSPLLKPQVGISKDELQLVEDNFYVANGDPQSELPLATESLLIFNRMKNQIDAISIEPPLFSLLSTTVTDSQRISLEPALKKQQMKNRILEAGASGVAFHQTITNLGEVKVEFLDSPFYSFALENSSADRANRFNNLRSQGSFPCSIDSRIIPPTQVANWVGSQWASYYIHAEPLHNPQPDNLTRSFRYLQKRPATEPLKYPSHYQPSIYMNDVVAFDDPYYATSLPSRAQISTMIASDTSPSSHYFLPSTLDFWYGSDKPGAMFQHYLRNLTNQSHRQWILGPLLDCAIREPQQLAILGINVPEIKELQVGLKNNDYDKEISLSWMDILGTIDLSSLKLSDPTTLTIQPKPMPSAPLEVQFVQPGIVFQPIIEINQEVLKLDEKNPKIPAYSFSEKQFAWPNLFLVSKLPLQTFTKKANLKIQDNDQEVEFKPYVAFRAGIVNPISGATQLTGMQERHLTTKIPHGLTIGDHLFIAGLQTETLGPWEVHAIEDEKTFTIISSPLILDIPSQFYAVKPLSDVLQLCSNEQQYYLYQCCLTNQWIKPPFSSLQFLWLAPANITGKNGESLKQMSWMSMYPEAKAITPVSPALLPSKIAAVMQVPSHHYERTLFFGDAGGAIHAEGTLATIPDPADASQNKIFFQFIRHDQETISIPMRDEVYHAEKTFFILKYLPHGQVIHNSLNTGPIN